MGKEKNQKIKGNRGKVRQGKIKKERRKVHIHDADISYLFLVNSA